ncbi:MAG TPA: hypothetical protein VGM51_16375 [Armatimonadota bacterium]|jgi:hypothetical protein
MNVLQFQRFGALCLIFTTTAFAPVTAGDTKPKTASAPVPYTSTGMPGISVRFVPSAPSAGAARQIYLKPGGSISSALPSTRTKSVDQKYTQSFPGPFNTTILMVDPALVVYETARVSPKADAKKAAGRLSTGHAKAMASRTHHSIAKTREGVR